MIQHSITARYLEYDSAEEMPPGDRLLIRMAQEATARSYAPYSRYHVGAVVKLSNGEIIAGSNQENASFPAGSCAERVALFAALSNFPDVPVEAIAIAARADDFTVSAPVTPCGICRQAIVEHELRLNRKIRILMSGQQGPVYQFESISDLLPLSFFESSLRK